MKIKLTVQREKGEVILMEDFYPSGADLLSSLRHFYANLRELINKLEAKE